MKGCIMKIKAVLFDCDGLMFDTERISQQMWRDSAARNHVTLPDDFFVRITGGSSQADRDYIHAIPGIELLFNDPKKKRFDLEFWKGFYPDRLNKKGLKELYAWLNEQGCRIAVCSSSSRAYVETLIGTVEGGLKYDAIVCGDMVRHPKPDPEIFLRGAQLIGVHPENCLVLEDSRQGILAAHAAGMHSCFIEDTIAPDDLMRSYFEFACGDLSEVIAILSENAE